MAEILKGAPVAAALSEELIPRADKLKDNGITPTLAILRVGERGDDIAYETGAMKRCDKIGIAVKRFLLPSDCTKEQLLDIIRKVNADAAIHGCLLFRPLPDRDIEAAACELLAPEKDVDGMTAGSLATVFAGKGSGYAPCTAQAVIELLDHYGVEIAGVRAAVLGRSLVIGRPVAMLLQHRNATVTVCHTKTENPPSICREAKLLVAAAGKPGVVDGMYAAHGQTIVDVGINVDANGKLCGDVKFDEVEPLVKAITPVPAGVGSVTTAVLAKHVIEAAEKAAK